MPFTIKTFPVLLFSSFPVPSECAPSGPLHGSLLVLPEPCVAIGAIVAVGDISNVGSGVGLGSGVSVGKGVGGSAAWVCAVIVFAIAIAEACTCAGSIVGMTSGPQALSKKADVITISAIGFNFLYPFL